MRNGGLEPVRISRDYFLCTRFEQPIHIPVELVLYHLFYKIKMSPLALTQEVLANHVYQFLHTECLCDLDEDFEAALNAPIQRIRDLEVRPFVYDLQTPGEPIRRLNPSEFFKQFVYLWRSLKFQHEGGKIIVSPLRRQNALGPGAGAGQYSLTGDAVEQLRQFAIQFIRDNGSRDVTIAELQTVIVRETLQHKDNSSLGLKPEHLPYPFEQLIRLLRDLNKKIGYYPLLQNYSLAISGYFRYKPVWAVWSKEDLLDLLGYQPYGLPEVEILENNLRDSIKELETEGKIWRLGSCRDTTEHVKKITLFKSEPIPSLLRDPKNKKALKGYWDGIISDKAPYTEKVAYLMKSGEAFNPGGIQDPTLFHQQKKETKRRPRRANNVCNKHLLWVVNEYDTTRKLKK